MYPVYTPSGRHTGIYTLYIHPQGGILGIYTTLGIPTRFTVGQLSLPHKTGLKPLRKVDIPGFKPSE